MSSRHRTQALVLKTFNFREQDKLISFYTKEFGKIEVLGKAIRKKHAKLRSFVQYPYYCEIDFVQGKNHKILTDTVLLNNFSQVRNNFKKIIIAYKISGLTLSLIKDSEKDEKIWYLLLSVFSHLNKKNFSSEQAFFLYYYFFWNFLILTGYKIDLHYCPVCQKRISNNFHFSLEKGLVHKNCFTSQVVPDYLINILKLFERNNLSLIDNMKQEWKKPLKQFCENLICQKLKK